MPFWGVYLIEEREIPAVVREKKQIERSLQKKKEILSFSHPLLETFQLVSFACIKKSKSVVVVEISPYD